MVFHRHDPGVPLTNLSPGRQQVTKRFLSLQGYFLIKKELLLIGSAMNVIFTLVELPESLVVEPS